MGVVLALPVCATKTLLAPSVSSGGYVFSTRNLQAVNEES